MLTAQEWAPFGPTGGAVAAMSADPVTGDVYLAGSSEIHLLRKGERIWQRRAYPFGISSPTETEYPVTQLIARGGELLAVKGGTDFHHSTDGGIT